MVRQDRKQGNQFVLLLYNEDNIATTKVIMYYVGNIATTKATCIIWVILPQPRFTVLCG